MGIVEAGSVSRHRLAVVVPYRSTSRRVEAKHLVTLCDRLDGHLKRQHTPNQIFILNQVDSRPFNRGALANAALVLLNGNSLQPFETEGSQTFDYVAIHDVDRYPARRNATCASASANYYSFPSASPRVLHPTSFAGGVLVVTTSLYRAVNGFSNSFWGWGEEDNDMFIRLRWCGLPPVHSERLDECMEHRDCADCKRQKQHVDQMTLQAHAQRARDRMLHPRRHMLRDGISTLNFTLHSAPRKIFCGRRQQALATVLDIDLSPSHSSS